MLSKDNSKCINPYTPSGLVTPVMPVSETTLAASCILMSVQDGDSAGEFFYWSLVNIKIGNVCGRISRMTVLPNKLLRLTQVQ